jgi:hypothetical protein
MAVTAVSDWAPDEARTLPGLCVPGAHFSGRGRHLVLDIPLDRLRFCNVLGLLFWQRAASSSTPHRRTARSRVTAASCCTNSGDVAGVVGAGAI